MPRPAPVPVTRLGIAVRKARGERGIDVLAAELGVSLSSLYRLERGTQHKPSTDTARRLAKWLGWTTDQVLDAADESAPPNPSEK